MCVLFYSHYALLVSDIRSSCFSRETLKTLGGPVDEANTIIMS